MIARKLWRRMLTICVVCVAAFTYLGVFSLHTAFADSTTYYVNNQSGSGCDDTGVGTAQGTPWCTFGPINSHTFGPGDHILLARGASWNQQMTINGSGSATNYASIGAYGTGDRPKIIRNGIWTDRAIRMNDPSYWNISDLEIGNAGDGILVHYTTTMHEGLHFSNIYVHNITGIAGGSQSGTGGSSTCATTDDIWNSGGITITGPTSLSIPAPGYAVRNVTFDSIEGTHNFNSVSIDWCTAQFFAKTADIHNFTQNVTLNHLYLHDDDGGGVAGDCGESLGLRGVQNVLLMNSNLRNEAACHVDTGTAAVILVSVKDVTFVNNMLTDLPNTASPDMTAVDHEVFTNSVHMRNNYIARNAGPGMEYLAIRNGIGDFASNHEASGNLFVNNGSALARLGNGDVPTGTIHDNLYWEPGGFTSGSADFSGFTFTNNKSVAAAGNFYYAADGFSGTQGANGWSYQSSSDGTQWDNLSYDNASQTWLPVGGGIPQVYQFEIHPAGCTSCWAARSWTAPVAGTVSIRGRVLKSDAGGGNGIVARVTKNTSPIIGNQTIAYNDQSGVDMNADNVTVAAGDIIRFEVNDNGSSDYDRTSWVPEVVYTTGALWNFNHDGDAQGWTLQNQLTGSVSGGAYNLSSSGTDPYMYGPDNLGLAASSGSCIQVRMKNGTSNTLGQIYFTTSADPTLTEAKSFTFTTVPNSDYTTYSIDTSTNSAWTGTIKRIRFDPGQAPGTYNLASLFVSTTSCPTGGSNLALGATPGASSSHENDGWSLSRVNDGNRSSGWSSESNLASNHTEWVQLDFATAKTFNKVDLYPRNDSNAGYGFPIDFTISVSNDAQNWSTVITQSAYPFPANGAVQHFTFSAQNARYLRVTGTSLRANPNENNAYRMQFFEIEVYSA